MDPMLSNGSRGYLMSYTDHSAQRRLKSNAPNEILANTSMWAPHGFDIIHKMGKTLKILRKKYTFTACIYIYTQSRKKAKVSLADT